MIALVSGRQQAAIAFALLRGTHVEFKPRAVLVGEAGAPV